MRQKCFLQPPSIQSLLLHPGGILAYTLHVSLRPRSTSVAFGAKRTLTEPRLQKADDEYAPFCNGPGDVKSPK
jgi:hypothetical protein